MDDNQQEQQELPEGARQIDPRRVLEKLQELDGRLVQLAVHQVVVEDQQAEIQALRAELVKATGGGESATGS